MNQHHTIHLSSWARLVGLALLLGVGLLASLGLTSRTAHAQPAATSTVSTCDDATLRSAIKKAASGDTIKFACSGTITLGSTLTISQNLTLDGNGQQVTLSGGDNTLVLIVNRGVTFTLNALTIAHGSSSNVGGLLNSSGTVNITNSTFANNSASAFGGGGGLVNNDGTVTISNSTFANNSASGSAGGGGLVNNGTVTISNSTFANNSAPKGSAISNFGGPVVIGNSIVANNTFDSCENLSGNGRIIDQSYNLSSDGSCGFANSSLQNTDPKLDPSGLQNNGGPTQTIALLASSPAIDHIPLGNVTNNFNCPATDQRGNRRPDPTFRPDGTLVSESVCDIGAYESNYDDDLGLTNIPATITVHATSPQGAVATYTPPTVVDEESPLPPVSCTPASGSTFPVGTTTVTCTVSESEDTNSPVSASFQVVVQPVITISATSVSATEGRIFSNVVVATGTAYVAGTLSASIAWGDGQTASGTVTLAPDGSYSVTGSHAYDEEGSFPISVTVSASGGGNATAGSSPASVADAVLTMNTPTVVIDKLAVTLTAAFFDADPDGTATDYTASINWGDGSTSTGTIGSNSASFSATGSHTYAKHTTYTVTVTIKDAGGSSVTRTLTMKV